MYSDQFKHGTWFKIQNLFTWRSIYLLIISMVKIEQKLKQKNGILSEMKKIFSFNSYQY